MLRYPALCAAALLSALTVSSPCQPRKAVFEGAQASHTWPLKEFDPALQSDWSGFQYLVLELRLSSPQRFELKVHDAGGVRAVRLSPVPGVWVRSAVPLAFLTHEASQGGDLAAVHNKSRPMMFLNIMGSPGAADSGPRDRGGDPQSGGRSEFGAIRSARLAREDPGDALLDDKPVVDEFGQWIDRRLARQGARHWTN